MAPSFIAKLVKAATPGHTRDRSSISSESVSDTRPRSTSVASSVKKPTISVSLHPSPSRDSVRTESTQMNVTVVPPSPFVLSTELESSSDEEDDDKPAGPGTRTTTVPPITIISPSLDTPAEEDDGIITPRLPQNPTSSQPAMSLRKQPSSKSIVVDSGSAQTTPKPLVESPTEAKFPPPQRENTLNVSDSTKRRPWRKSTTRKPTGLASAIAASGLAMANPTMSASTSAAISDRLSSPPPGSPPSLGHGQSSNESKKGDRKGSTNGNTSPYLSRSPASSRSGRHTKSMSAELSPRTPRSRRSTNATRRTTSSQGADDEYRAEYYSGLEEGSSGEEGSGSSSDLSDDELPDDDIPVTGFAVASNKRNADFHELFPSVPEGDYLIEDYGCALQREILIQGRLYISENHICFHANIFGWITDLSIPISEIQSLEKKMTAFVIPNAIQMTTRQAKYTFASFLARDTTYDVIYNIWRLARPANGSAGPAGDALSNGRQSLDAGESGVADAVPGSKKKAPQRKHTTCLCGREGQHYTEGVLDVVIPGTPDKILALMFQSAFLRQWLEKEQKLTSLHMSDWSPPLSPGSKGNKRSLSYIKPLNAPVGPKQTKCEIEDEIMHYDPEGYISIVTTTRTPDVPSGGIFAIKTRTCMTWASIASTRVVVSTQVEWSGRSLFRSMIEPAAINGQKGYHSDLEKAMKVHIEEHKADFLPDGFGVDDQAEAAAAAAAAQAEEERHAAERKAKDEQDKANGKAGAAVAGEAERKKKLGGLGAWALDTLEGAFEVGTRSASGAIELLKDALDAILSVIPGFNGSGNRLLYVVILLLVLSNVWTLMRVGTVREESALRFGRREADKQREDAEKERWVQSIVRALWDELEAGGGSTLAKKVAEPLPSSSAETPSGTQSLEEWKAELDKLYEMMGTLEQRIQGAKVGLEEAQLKLSGTTSLD